MNKKIHPEISIIIVNYNSSDLLSGCIESILSHIHIDFEIIVYDNASSDGSADRTAHPLLNNSRVKILLDPENIGFAIANNRAAKVAKGKYLHFLNPDTIIDSDLNADYEHLLANEQRAVFVTGLREGDGKIRKMKHLIPTIGNYFNALFLKQKAAYWNIGASIITDRSTFNGIGGWPEDYFMYAEDLDFFYIIKYKNIPVVYLNSEIIHIGKGTTENIWTDLQRLILIEKSTRKFYKKYGLYYQYFIIRPVQLVYLLFHEPHLFFITLKAIAKSLFK